MYGQSTSPEASNVSNMSDSPNKGIPSFYWQSSQHSPSSEKENSSPGSSPGISSPGMQCSGSAILRRSPPSDETDAKRSRTDSETDSSPSPSHPLYRAMHPMAPRSSGGSAPPTPPPAAQRQQQSERHEIELEDCEQLSHQHDGEDSTRNAIDADAMPREQQDSDDTLEVLINCTSATLKAKLGAAKEAFEQAQKDVEIAAQEVSRLRNAAKPMIRCRRPRRRSLCSAASIAPAHVCSPAACLCVVFQLHADQQRRLEEYLDRFRTESLQRQSQSFAQTFNKANALLQLQDTLLMHDNMLKQIVHQH